MNSRRFVSNALIYLAVLAALFAFTYGRLRTLAAGAVVADWFPEKEYKERNPAAGPPKPFYSLLTNRSYGSNERARVWLNYRDVDSMDFRVYRVNDPAKFFKQLDNPHQLGEDEENEFTSLYRKRKPTFLEKVRRFKEGFYLRLRDYFRSQLKNSSRRGFNRRFREPEEERVERTPLNVADYARVPLLNPDQMVSSWREKLPPLEEEYDRRAVSLGRREPGVYVVEAVNGDLRAYGVVLVTDLMLIEKGSRDGQMLVYAVNRQSGAPRAGVRIDIVRDADTVYSGTTDNQGLLRMKLDRQKLQGGGAQAEGEEAEEGEGEEGGEESSPSYLVMASEKENFSVNDLDSFYYSNYGGDEAGAGELTSYVYTDRPVYRPNQKVYFKGVLRRLTERGYQLPKGTVSVTVSDTNSATLFERELPLSARGTFSGELDLPEDAALGSYNINVSSGEGSAYAYFEVREYKKPEYKIAVSTQDKFVPVGSRMKFNVSARYFFGAPVTRAAVKYYVYRSRYYHYFADPQADPLDDFGVEGEEESSSEYESDYGGYGDSLVEEGEGKLGADGNYAVEFTVPEPKGKEAWDYTYRLEAQVTDAARRMMSASAEVVGTRGSTVVEAEPERYAYAEGDTARVRVRTSDYFGNAKPARVNLTFVEQTWEKIEKNDYGYTYFDYKLREKELSSAAVETNQQGEAFFDYRVGRPGSIAVKAAFEENGRKVTSAGGSFWVGDRNNRWSDYSYQEDQTIKLVPDKKSYKAGETAHVLALLPKEQAHLLVTTELMSVMSVRQISAAGRAVMIDVPIEARFAPNVFLSVTYVKQGEMFTNEASIVVPPRDKLLKLEIIPNKDTFKPRETVSYTISARGGDGAPVAGAEVSLGVVDEAVYSIVQDATEDIRRTFYGRRYNSVSTSFSANFNFTGFAGKEPIKLAANKRANSLADFKNEGDFAEPLVRKIFKDTAYWQPAVVTGADGRAVVKVELPDNLTTWRATARAVTGDTRVGWTTSKVVERKDVIIRLATPRFFTAGDTVTLSGVVHNYLNQDKQTRVSLEVQGARLLDQAVHDVVVPKNGETRINWRVSAPQTGQMTLLAKALTDTESDAVEFPLEIVPRGLRQTRGEAVTLGGDADEERTVTINLPNNADPRGRNLRLEAAPSVAASLFGALDYLTSYPWGCTEQTMSSFLPTVIVKNTLREVRQASVSDQSNIDGKVKKGLKRLYAFQHEDGGWGWWKDDPTDPWMTAYVVDGLTLASRAGYQIEDARVERGRAKLAALLATGKKDDGKPIETETRAYMVYALSVSGGADARFVDDMFTNRGRLQPYGRALLALTLKQRGDGRAQTVAAEIERTASVSEFDAHWQSRKQYEGNFAEDTSLEATALSIKALAQVTPESGVMAKAARWLVANRRGGYYWTSTRQTAFVIYGLTDYLKVSDELSPDYTLEVYVNNEQVLTRQVTGAEAARADSFVVKRRNEEVANGSQIRVVKRGRGVLYFTAALDFATNEEQVQPQSTSALKITREYLRLFVEEDAEGNPKWRVEPLAGDVRSGDTIVVRLNVEGAPAPYVLIEDPIPAGCEQLEQVGNLNLNWSEQGWSDWYSAREFRDQRTGLFLNYFDGKAMFQYALRVQEPGDFRVAPARVELMYAPTVQANTASGTLRILDK